MSQRFKVGDKLKNTDDPGDGGNGGKTGTVTIFDPATTRIHVTYYDGVVGTDVYPYTSYKLIRDKINVTQMISQIARKILDPRTTKLVKAGFLDEQLQLTTVGKNALDSILVSNLGEDLEKLADEVIQERKEE